MTPKQDLSLWGRSS